MTLCATTGSIGTISRFSVSSKVAVTVAPLIAPDAESEAQEIAPVALRLMTPLMPRLVGAPLSRAQISLLSMQTLLALSAPIWKACAVEPADRSLVLDSLRP